MSNPDPKARNVDPLDIDQPPEVNGQMLLDAGLNIWALHLLMESIGRLNLAPAQDVGHLAFRFWHRGEFAEIMLSYRRIPLPGETSERTP